MSLNKHFDIIIACKCFTFLCYSKKIKTCMILGVEDCWMWYKYPLCILVFSTDMFEMNKGENTPL